MCVVEHGLIFGFARQSYEACRGIIFFRKNLMKNISGKVLQVVSIMAGFAPTSIAMDDTQPNVRPTALTAVQLGV